MKTKRTLRLVQQLALAVVTLGTMDALSVRAETVIVPTAFASSEAGGGSSVLNDNIRLQEIYAASTLPPGPILISGMKLRPSAVAGSAFTSTIENIQINLSTTRTDPAALSAQFAANIGSNDTIVFAGALSLSSQFTGPGYGPKDFDIDIPFSTPFLYDPADGNLLVDFHNFSGSRVTYVDAGPSADRLANRAFALGANATSATTIDFGAEVLQFTYTYASSAPFIVKQPEDQQAVIGGTAELSVEVRGTAPFTYQWSRDGEPLPGATERSLLFPNVQLTDAGDYAVTVNNSFGSVTSRVAVLVVTDPPAPTISAQPRSQWVAPGGTARFSVIAFSLTPILGYQWQLGGTVLEGATNSTLVLEQVQPSQAGTYAVVVRNASGSVQSADATLVVTNLNALTLPPDFETTEGGGGSSVLSDNIRLQEVYSSSLFPSDPIVITGLRFRPSALYGRAFSGTLANFQLNLSSTQRDPGALSTTFAANVGPDDTVVFAGALPLSSSATGPASGPKDFDIVIPLSVPFQYDPAAGNLLVDVHNFSGGPVSLVDAAAPELGQVSRVYSLGANATVGFGGDHGADVIQFIYEGTPISPSIVRHPTNLVVLRGEDATFTVLARGTAPLQYQWLFNDSPLPNATSATLSLSQVEPAAAGSYRVIVANGAGTATSQVATLTVEMGRHLRLSTPAQRQEGSTVSVLLELASEGDVAGMTFAIYYNPDFLSNPQLTWAHALSSSFNSLNYSDGEIRASFASSEAVPAGTQLVASIEFFLRSVPEDLETPLPLTIVDVSDPLGESITRGNKSYDSTVRIARRTVLGDNNANGRLDVGDATVILRHLAQLEPTRSWDITGNDLNHNSGLDSGDAIKALRAAANVDPQPGGGDGGGEGGGGFMAAAAPGGILPPESILLTPERVLLTGKSTVTMQVRLANIRSGLSAAAFTVDYPTNALRFVNAQSYRAGALVSGNALTVWNLSPQQNNFSAQDGHLTMAVSSAQPWAESNGVLAELTFQIQPGASAQYAWPVRAREAEISPSGYANRYLLATDALAIGRPAVPGELSRPTRDVSGRFQFNLQGDANATYLIETSSDLIHWTEAKRILNQTGLILFTDPNPVGTGARFFRSRPLE